MYSTNITDNQWQVIEKNINVQERKKRHYLEGVVEDIIETLHAISCKAAGREDGYSLWIIDSRSVRTSHHVDPSCKGTGGNKKIKGYAEGYPKAGTQVPAPEEESCRRRIPGLAW